MRTKKKRYEELRDRVLYDPTPLTPEEHEEFQTLSNARNKQLARENNKLARGIGYARGVKQMKEEGAI